MSIVCPRVHHKALNSLQVLFETVLFRPSKNLAYSFDNIENRLETEPNRWVKKQSLFTKLQDHVSLQYLLRAMLSSSVSLKLSISL